MVRVLAARAVGLPAALEPASGEPVAIAAADLLSLLVQAAPQPPKAAERLAVLAHRSLQPRLNPD